MCVPEHVLYHFAEKRVRMRLSVSCQCSDSPAADGDIDPEDQNRITQHFGTLRMVQQLHPGALQHVDPLECLQVDAKHG